MAAKCANYLASYQHCLLFPEALGDTMVEYQRTGFSNPSGDGQRGPDPDQEPPGTCAMGLIQALARRRAPINAQRTSPSIQASHERFSYARLHGRWLLLGQATWMALVALTLGIFFASFPVFLAQLHTWWVKGSSSYWQITSEQAELLSSVGWSLDDYARLVVALTLASGVIYLILSTLLIWRRPDDRMALLVALLLVSFSTSNATDIVSGARDSLWQIPNKGLISLWQLLLVIVFSLFPSGRFVPQ